MKILSRYEAEKEEARQEAIAWAYECSELALSWEGVLIAQEYFEKLGRRYGLLQEFRENGII